MKSSTASHTRDSRPRRGGRWLIGTASTASTRHMTGSAMRHCSCAWRSSAGAPISSPRRDGVQVRDRIAQRRQLAPES